MSRRMGQTIAGKINRKTDIADDWLKKGYEFGRYRFYEDAIRCFNAAIELNSLDPLAWKCKGLALEACGRSSEADIAFAKARSLGLMA